MPDLKDELRHLADEAARQARPLPVADVIREGDRRHRRIIMWRRRETARAPGVDGRARPGRRWPGWVTPVAAAAAIIAVIAVTTTVSSTLHSPGPAAHRPAATTVYAVYYPGDIPRHKPLPGIIIPIKTTTSTPGTPIRVPKLDGGAAVTPNGKTIYASAGGSIIPISTASGKLGKPIHMPPYGHFDITANPDGKTVYASNEQNVAIPINTANNRPGKPIRASGAGYITCAPDGKTAYAIHAGSRDNSTITPINTATNRPGKPIHVSADIVPSSFAFAPDGKTAYVAGVGTVTPINLATNMAGKPIRVPGAGASAIGVTPDGKTVYVGTQKGNGLSTPYTESVVPISTATNTPGKPIQLGRRPAEEMAMAPDGKTVYISNISGPAGAVVPISTATNTAGKPIPVGQLVTIGLSPDGNTLYGAALRQVSGPPQFRHHIKIVPINTVTNARGKPIVLPIEAGDTDAVIAP